MAPKAMGKEGEEGWAVGENYSTDVSRAGAEGLPPSFCWGEADHGPQDHGVGDCDAQDVKTPNQEGNNQTIDGIDLDISTRQLGLRHVVKVGMENHIAFAIEQSFGEYCKRNDKYHASKEGEKPTLAMTELVSIVAKHRG